MRVKRLQTSSSCTGWALCTKINQLMSSIKKCMHLKIPVQAAILTTWKVPLKLRTWHGCTNCAVQWCCSIQCHWLKSFWSKLRHLASRHLSGLWVHFKWRRRTWWSHNRWPSKRVTVSWCIIMRRWTQSKCMYKCSMAEISGSWVCSGVLLDGCRAVLLLSHRPKVS